jgi:hypothetical protein
MGATAKLGTSTRQQVFSRFLFYTRLLDEVGLQNCEAFPARLFDTARQLFRHLLPLYD